MTRTAVVGTPVPSGPAGMPDFLGIPDYYRVLRVESDASDADVRTAYRRRAKLFHPDLGGDVAHFQQVREAYDLLSDPRRRASYDADRALRLSRVLAVAAERTAAAPGRTVSSAAPAEPSSPTSSPWTSGSQSLYDVEELALVRQRRTVLLAGLLAMLWYLFQSSGAARQLFGPVGATAAGKLAGHLATAVGTQPVVWKAIAVFAVAVVLEYTVSVVGRVSLVTGAVLRSTARAMFLALFVVSEFIVTPRGQLLVLAGCLVGLVDGVVRSYRRVGWRINLDP